MRIIVMFDLPVETAGDRREYAKFRKHLIKSGFVMVQESVYSKIAVNPTMGDIICDGLRKHKPEKGMVTVLKVTEKQYSAMEYLVGEKHTDVVDSDEKLVVI